MDSDAELLHAFLDERSQEAFAALVRRHLPVVYGAALRRLGGDGHRAQDVAQEVFTLLARKAAGLRRHPALTGWLYSTTHHLAARAMRTEQRRQLREATAQAVGAGEEVPWDRIRPVIDDALLDLPESDRLAVLLRYFQDEKYSDIGARLGLTDSGARMRTEQALESLRLALSKRGITSTGAILAGALAAHGAVIAPGGLAAAIAANAAAGVSVGGLAILMSTSTFKTGCVVVALAAATAGLLYQNHANSILHTEVASLQQELAAKTQSSIDNFRRANATAQTNKSELDRLRAELDRGSTMPPSNDALAAWAVRLDSLKQRFAEHPEQSIPEFRLLTEDDWLDASKRKLETEDDYRIAMADLRNYAEAALQKLVQPALKRYLEANGNQFPTELAQLQPFFDPPLDAALLVRWTIRRGAEVGFASVSERVITPREPVDEEQDHRRAFGPSNSSITSWPIVIGPVEYPRGLGRLIAAYRAANSGLNPPTPAQLAAYATTPHQQALLEETMRQGTPAPDSQRAAP